MAVRSKITIFNAALLRTGNDPVSEGDGSFELQALEANYDEIVRAAFEGNEYPFGKSRSILTSRSAGRFGFDDAYVYPNEAIHISEVYIDDASASDARFRWEVDAATNELMVNSNGGVVEIKYLRVGLEHTWSAQFAKGIQRRLEAVLKDVEEESQEAAGKESEADFAFLKSGVKAAKSRDARRTFKRGGGRLVRRRRGG